MSDSAPDVGMDDDRPDLAAVRELSQLIHALGEEMAAWRRRAHEAEGRLRELERTSGVPATPARAVPQAASALEAENRELRQRLDAARERTKVLMERLRFLRQQQEQEASR